LALPERRFLLSDAVLEHFRRPYETFVVGQ
jgi:hypothetical protein